MKKGDKVTWETPQGETEGVVEKVLTEPMKIKGHMAKASKEEPQLLVKSDKTGKEAAHRPESVKRKK